MKKLAAALLAFSAVSSVASAQNAYFGGDFSFINADVIYSPLNFKESADPTALRIKGGVELNENFAIEGVIGLGLQDGEIGNTDWEIGLDNMIGVNAVGIIPLDRNFAVFAKLGFASVEFEDSDGDTYDDTGISFGFGGKVAMSQQAALTIEYTILPDTENGQYNIEVESDMLSIGAQFSF